MMQTPICRVGPAQGVDSAVEDCIYSVLWRLSAQFLTPEDVLINVSRRRSNIGEDSLSYFRLADGIPLGTS